MPMSVLVPHALLLGLQRICVHGVLLFAYGTLHMGGHSICDQSALSQPESRIHTARPEPKDTPVQCTRRFTIFYLECRAKRLDGTKTANLRDLEFQWLTCQFLNLWRAATWLESRSIQIPHWRDGGSFE